MFKIQNNRLYYGGISFSLPTGLYLDTANEMGYNDCNIAFCPQDHSFRIMLVFLTYNETTESYVKSERQSHIEADHFIYGDHHPKITSIQQIKLNDLNGFAYMTYSNVHAHFDSAHKNNIHLYIYVEIAKSKCIEEVLARQEVKDFFADIKMEEKE